MKKAEASIEEILRPLIETDTQNPPGHNYPRVCKILREQLEPVGCEIRLLKAPMERVKELFREATGISGERVNLIATLSRSRGKSLILNGHMDVVPATGSWTHPPFELTREGGYWYGRGVADMKGALAGLVKVVQTLSSDKTWRGTVILEAVCDEEIGGYTGTAYLHDAHLVEGDYCIVADGYISHITNAANGCLRFRVTLRGKSVHSSRNWSGINAIEKAGHLVTKLEEYNKALHYQKSTVPANPKSGVDFLIPSLTIGTIQGGTKVNIVPDTCVLEIDRRVTPDEERVAAITDFEKTLKNLKTDDGDFKYDLLVGGFHESFSIPDDQEPIPTLREAYRQVTGLACPVYGGLGCYDAAHVAKSGVPVAVLGAGRMESNVHGIDERVKVNDVINLANILEATALKLLR